MTNKIMCPVCQVAFMAKEPPAEKGTVLCPVCGAKLEITAFSPEIMVRKFPQDPEVEIRERVDNFARLKGYIFNEDKELVMEGLLQKKEKYGDFFCPCKIENIPENICPCLETRRGRVQKEGMCF
ncbi:ferredoxin-thioredoxin reductase catalytic domain-containing protein [Pelotomaculum propionicicum]|uniref:ferredoxin-thioredoxin reductase catalytic domain-containing protein n=1 Tax=Pelotomaculum propionicicum TaxID=258475 RepID=UPI003B7E01BD